MNNVLNKTIVLQLNNVWQPIGTKTVQAAMIDLSAGVSCVALDINYDINVDGNPILNTVTINPVDWNAWIALPVRDWEFGVKTIHSIIRVPTVLVAKHYSKMPTREFKGKPNINSIWIRDGGIDQYTGKKLSRKMATVDHIIPKYHGGTNKWENVALTHKDINTKKGNKRNKEAGLTLIKQPRKPGPMPRMMLINHPVHITWTHFLVSKLLGDSKS